MKKEALMALLADLPDGSEIRIPAPVLHRSFDTEDLATWADLRWYDRLLNAVAALIPAVVVLILIGFVILGARWLASGGDLDQSGHPGVIAEHRTGGATGFGPSAPAREIAQSMDRGVRSSRESSVITSVQYSIKAVSKPQAARSCIDKAKFRAWAGEALNSSRAISAALIELDRSGAGRSGNIVWTATKPACDIFALSVV